MKFRMVDRILAWESRVRIRGAKTVSFEEYGLKEAFGGEERLPESLLAESLFQLGNWLVVLSSDFSQMGLVIRFERIAFAGALRPGERMEMEIEVRRYREDGILFDGRACVESREIASGEGVLAVPAPLADYVDPDDLRVLYGEIFRPDGEGRG